MQYRVFGKLLWRKLKTGHWILYFIEIIIPLLGIFLLVIYHLTIREVAGGGRHGVK